MTEALSDTLLEESRDTLPMEAINTNRPEACKFTIMNLNTEKVVLGDPICQICNVTNQLINDQGLQSLIKLL